MKFFTKMLQRLRAATQHIITVFFVKVRDPATGRLPISNSTIRVVAAVLGITFVIFVIISNIMSSYRAGNGLTDYEKEVKNDRGMAARPIVVDDLFDNDPLKTLSTSTVGQEDARSSIKTEAQVVTKEECFTLIQKLKDGEGNFSLQEQSKLDECVNNNVAELSPEDLAMAKALNDKSLTPEQRKALAEQWSTGSSNKKVSGLDLILPALKGDSAKKASETLGSSGISVPKELIIDLAKGIKSAGNSIAEKALKKAYEAKPLTPKEKSAINQVFAKLTGSPSSNNPEKSNAGSFFGGDSGRETQIKEITERVKAKQAELDALRSDLALAQAAAKEAAQKMAQGKALSKDESQVIKEVADKSEKMQGIIQEIEADKAALQAILNDLKEMIADANSITRDIQTGYSEHAIAGEIRTSRRGKGLKKPTKAEIEFDIKQKELMKIKSFNDSLLGGTSVDGKLLNQYAFGDKPMEIEKLSVSFVEKDMLHLSSNGRYLAVLDTEILYPSGEKAQQFRVRTNMDMYDSETQKIAIPKGTLLIGYISSFNEETGVADISLTKARVGKKMLDFSIRVASANGMIGLRGDVYDNRGRKLVAALITSFTGGAIGWFSQNLVAQYQNSKDAATALQGSAMNGAAEVVNKLSNMMAADLNGTPAVFFVPKGTPLILLPDDQ